MEGRSYNAKPTVLCLRTYVTTLPLNHLNELKLTLGKIIILLPKGLHIDGPIILGIVTR